MSLPGRFPETEEQRPRPACSGDEARNFGKRTVASAAKTYTFGKHSDLMGLTTPLSDEQCTGNGDTSCSTSFGVRRQVVGDAFKPPARRRVQTTELSLLQAVSDRPREQLAADP
jgi:hypothetical protein